MRLKAFLLRYRFSITIFIGILIGTCYVNIAYRCKIAVPEVYDGNYLSRYADVAMNYYSLWKYIIKYRIRDFAIIGIMGLTVLRRYIISLYLVYIGICAGMLISTSVMYYGFTGLGVYLSSVLPQYIFYGIAVYFLYRMFYMHGMKWKNAAVIVGLTIILLFVGTYMEAYCNPELLKKLYLYLYSCGQ